MRARFTQLLPRALAEASMPVVLRQAQDDGHRIASKLTPVTIEFSGKVWYWRGPAPFFFVTVPTQHAKKIKEMERVVTYGWGMIPCVARIGKTEWTTALWPKDGAYILGLKDKVRKAEGIEDGDDVTVQMQIGID